MIRSQPAPRLLFCCAVLLLSTPDGPASAQRPMVELDHVFVLVPARGGPEIAALRSAGFYIDTVPAHHTGLGTASVSVYFENAYFELLWLDPGVEVSPEWKGRAEALARAVDAPRLSDGEFGWVDRPVDDIIALGTKAEETKAERGWLLATDFRPHTHHFLVLAQARASNTGSGELELAGGRTCMFFTSWGDGVFPVFADRDAAGNLLRIRVQLETDGSVEAMEHVNG